MFDPTATVMAVKLEMHHLGWVVFQANERFIKTQRLHLTMGQFGVLSYAIIWLVFIPISGVLTSLFQNPFVVVILALFGVATALGGLIAAFYHMPRALASQRHQVLIVTPDGFVLADLVSGQIVRAADFHALDALTYKVISDDESGYDYRLFMTQGGKTTRWTIDEFFQAKPEFIANTLVHTFERARDASARSQRS